jgi:hypothetical protein
MGGMMWVPTNLRHEAAQRPFPVAIASREPHVHPMTSRKRKSRNVGHPYATALARWETEGGALGPPSREGRDKRASLSEQETHVLQCLGAAVLLQWNDLPTLIQRELFESSTSAVEPGEIAQLKEQIARFLHKHKDDDRTAQ